MAKLDLLTKFIQFDLDDASYLVTFRWNFFQGIHHVKIATGSKKRNVFSDATNTEIVSTTGGAFWRWKEMLFLVGYLLKKKPSIH